MASRGVYKFDNEVDVLELQWLREGDDDPVEEVLDEANDRGCSEYIDERTRCGFRQ